jgi:hypothetical protein
MLVNRIAKIFTQDKRAWLCLEMAKRGLHPYLVSKLVGHSFIGITLQYYQPTEADMWQAMRGTQ